MELDAIKVTSDLKMYNTLAAMQSMYFLALERPMESTNEGFCNYLMAHFGNKTPGERVWTPYIEDVYQNLLSTAKTMTEINETEPWWPHGEIAPRLECIKLTIKRLYEKIPGNVQASIH